MSREDYELFKALQQKKQQESVDRRILGNVDFEEASKLASQAGMTFVKHSEIHYQLRGKTGWVLNVYPGNRRIFHDRNHLRPPYLKIQSDWTLIDIVNAAIDASIEGD